MSSRHDQGAPRVERHDPPPARAPSRGMRVAMLLSRLVLGIGLAVPLMAPNCGGRGRVPASRYESVSLECDFYNPLDPNPLCPFGEATNPPQTGSEPGDRCPQPFAGMHYCGICEATDQCSYCPSSNACGTSPCSAYCGPTESRLRCPSQAPIDCGNDYCCPGSHPICCEGRGMCGTDVESCVEPTPSSGGGGGGGSFDCSVPGGHRSTLVTGGCCAPWGTWSDGRARPCDSTACIRVAGSTSAWYETRNGLMSRVCRGGDTACLTQAVRETMARCPL